MLRFCKLEIFSSILLQERLSHKTIYKLYPRDATDNSTLGRAEPRLTYYVTLRERWVGQQNLTVLTRSRSNLTLFALLTVGGDGVKNSIK